MSQPKLDEKQLEQFSRQLEEQLRKQVYDVISQFLDEDPAANQSTPQAGTQRSHNKTNLIISETCFIASPTLLVMPSNLA